MGYKQYCKEPEKIENWEKAKKDGFVGWCCHHRLETHTPDGKRRDVDITQRELKALRMYYNRPPEELIFLTIKEHNAFNKGKKRSDETKNKISEAMKGEKNPNYGKPTWNKGKHLSEETKMKLSEALKGQIPWSKGKKFSEEHKKRLSESHKGKSIGNKNALGNKNNLGKHWFNNGKENMLCFECPDGFIPGRLR